MKPNIGLINSLVRISCGFTLLSWATARLVRKPNHSMPLFLAMIGGMKVAEGITRFCPLTYMFEEQIVQIKKQNTEQQETERTEPLENPTNLF